MINLLFIGDLVAEPGLKALQLFLPEVIKKYNIDFCVLNGENSHEGKGLNENILKKIFNCGVNVITGGDHSFDKHLIFSYMGKEKRLLRPLNYPKGTYGNGFGIYEWNNIKIGIINLQGRTFLKPIDCPFRTADWILNKIKEETKVIFIDMHAEATAEKIAFGYYLDGQVSAIAGSHTHVQTADEKILPNGTGYITDAGMTGSYHSVIGFDIETAINRFIFQTPQKASYPESDLKLCGVMFCIDTENGKTINIERIIFPK